MRGEAFTSVFEEGDEGEMEDDSKTRKACLKLISEVFSFSSPKTLPEKVHSTFFKNLAKFFYISKKSWDVSSKLLEHILLYLFTHCKHKLKIKDYQMAYNRYIYIYIYICTNCIDFRSRRSRIYYWGYSCS